MAGGLESAANHRFSPVIRIMVTMKRNFGWQDSIRILALVSLPVLAGQVEPTDAAIAVFSDGRTMKIESFDVGDDRARLSLPGGGTLVVASSRLDRILDDENLSIPDPAITAGNPAALAVSSPGRLRFRTGASVAFSSIFDDWIVGLSAKHDVDPALVSAVVKAESAFSPWARSSKGAVGLMQLMPATADRLGIKNRYDPVANLDGGIRYLRWLSDRYEGDLELVLAAYNSGEAAVDRFGGVPPYRETVTYVRKIVGFLRDPNFSFPPRNLTGPASGR